LVDGNQHDSSEHGRRQRPYGFHTSTGHERENETSDEEPQ